MNEIGSANERNWGGHDVKEGWHASLQENVPYYCHTDGYGTQRSGGALEANGGGYFRDCRKYALESEQAYVGKVPQKNCPWREQNGHLTLVAVWGFLEGEYALENREVDRNP